MPDRGRERKRRRRRSLDDDDDEESGFTGWKLGLVVGVIVVCFAMLYPTVIHPMLMSFMGRKEPQRPTPTRPPVHPGMGGPGAHRPGGRADVHPAMRMAQQQAETQSGGGRGMFTWMLPIYTVGVVVFLLYTLFKSKGKKKRRSRYDSSEYSSDDADEYSDRLKKKIGKRKLRGLQERLQQTEEAMSKILEQLEAVQAAGALIEGDQDQAEGASDDKENSEPKTILNVKNDQYISDLEKALRDFKVLSDAYEEERGQRRRGSNSEGDDASTEELISGSDEEESEEEEEEMNAKKGKTKASRRARDDDSEEETRQKRKKKVQKKKRKEEDEEEEQEEPEQTEETAQTVKALPETAKQTQSSAKNVRRRARKV